MGSETTEAEPGASGPDGSGTRDAEPSRDGGPVGGEGRIEPAAADSTTPDSFPAGGPDGTAPDPEATTPEIAPPEAALEAFRVALEGEDLEALERIYGGQIPGSDRRMLSQIFDNAGSLDVEMRTRDLERGASRAVVEVDYPMSYVLERTGRGQKFTLKLRVELALVGNGWQIVALERR
jgi:hypothetical protein